MPITLEQKEQIRPDAITKLPFLELTDVLLDVDPLQLNYDGLPRYGDTYIRDWWSIRPIEVCVNLTYQRSGDIPRHYPQAITLPASRKEPQRFIVGQRGYQTYEGKILDLIPVPMHGEPDDYDLLQEYRIRYACGLPEVQQMLTKTAIDPAEVVDVEFLVPHNQSGKLSIPTWARQEAPDDESTEIDPEQIEMALREWEENLLTQFNTLEERLSVITSGEIGSTAIDFAASGDIGLLRDKQQDAFRVLQTANGRMTLAAVADGLGGHSRGEVASQSAVSRIGEEFLDFGATVDFDDSRSVPTILAEATRDLFAKAAGRVSYDLFMHDGATTLVTALALGNQVAIGNIGDSRAYMVPADADQPIRQITHDHSLVQYLIDTDQLKPEERASYPYRNHLFKAITGESVDVEPNVFTTTIGQGECLVLASDGLWNMVPDAEIARITREATTTQEAVAKLIALANENGGEDNITVIVMKGY